MSCHMHRDFSELPHIFEQLLHGISSPVHTRYKCSHEKLERKLNAINIMQSDLQLDFMEDIKRIIQTPQDFINKKTTL